MRFPVVAASFVLLVAPSAAEAGSVAREGTELVFRANPGDTDVLTVAQASGSVTFMAGRGATISAGPGCEIANLGVRCDAADATVVRVLLEDGDDRLDINGRVPVVADLGPGDDEVYTVAGGSKLSLVGGDGDDYFGVNPGPPTAADIDCGPGNDRWSAGPQSRPGAGCAPHLVGVTPRTVSRALHEGSLSAPANGSVLFRRYLDDSPGATIARGTFSARAGALRVRLTPTPAGRRVLQRNPTPRVIVVIRTSAGGEHGETMFASRIR